MMLRRKVEEVYSARPTLLTQRLLLRRLNLEDANALYSIASIPEVSRYLMWDRHPSLKYTKRYLNDLNQMYDNNEYFEWGVITRQDGRLIGTCGFTKFDFNANRGEIGYSFRPDTWGKGYATEAARATVAFGFRELNLSSVYACFAMENLASIRVLTKCGMQYIGEDDPMIIKGEWHRIGSAAISRKSYIESAGEIEGATSEYNLITLN